MSHYVSAKDVDRETRFYKETEDVYQDIAAFKRKLQERNNEFDALLEYYEQHKGQLDVYHRPVCGPRAMRPNLGTTDESWYYLDGMGNKIWVRNLELNTSDPRSGAFDSGKNADGRICVVTIPKTRLQYSVKRDYHEKVAEYDASYRLPQSTNSASHHSHPSSPPCSCCCHATTPYFPLSQDVRLESLEDRPMSVEAYIAGQKQLNAETVDRKRNSQQQPELIYRPPATVEEAEARLVALKREAAAIEASRARR